MRSAVLAPVVLGPPDVPSGPSYDFRGIFVRDTEFTQCYPAAEPRPFTNMHFNAMECFSSGSTTNILTRMSLLQGTHLGWCILGNFVESTSGGSFGGMTDAAVATIVDGIVDHPHNSHRYSICDEPNLQVGTWTLAQQNANRDTLRNRRNLIKAHDPQAIVNIADFLQNQLQPSVGRPFGMWGGVEPVGASVYADRVVDEVWISGYPRPQAVADPTYIPALASWCDAAGVPYMGVVSCHDFLVDKPAYPTAAQFQFAMQQWAATNQIGYLIYIWFDGEGTYHLSEDPVGLAHQSDVGAQNAIYTPA